MVDKKTIPSGELETAPIAGEAAMGKYARAWVESAIRKHESRGPAAASVDGKAVEDLRRDLVRRIEAAARDWARHSERAGPTALRVSKAIAKELAPLIARGGLNVRATEFGFECEWLVGDAEASFDVQRDGGVTISASGHKKFATAEFGPGNPPSLELARQIVETVSGPIDVQEV